MNNILIASDIHGSYKYAKLLINKQETFKIEKIILLGDLYYNGPRNIVPDGYSPKEVVSLLNENASKIIAVKGNCESEVDLTVSKFTISDTVYLSWNGLDIICTHGHKKNFNNLPEGGFDIFLQGHTHIGYLEIHNNHILANPGSITLPKDNHHSYMLLNEESLQLKDLFTNETYKEIKIQDFKKLINKL